ncbi:MAG: ATP-dependent protease subunit HslV [Pseudomonadota bacterium]
MDRTEDWRFRGTTILAVRRGDSVAVAGDGQVTLNQTVMKHKAVKVRKIYNGKVIIGFAGATADALNLFERFEAKLDQFNGNMKRAAVELAKAWRTDKYLRKLEAIMITVDKDSQFLLSGSGDVIEPDEGVLAIGSGAGYAKAAALALLQQTELDARIIAVTAMKIAANICIYTNDELTIEEL